MDDRGALGSLFRGAVSAIAGGAVGRVVGAGDGRVYRPRSMARMAAVAVVRASLRGRIGRAVW
jgi:hypothetical protein